MTKPDDKLKNAYENAKNEAIKALLQSSLVYALKTHNFNDKNYYKEDFIEILSDYQTLILTIVNELIKNSFAVMKERIRETILVIEHADLK